MSRPGRAYRAARPLVRRHGLALLAVLAAAAAGQLAVLGQRPRAFTTDDSASYLASAVRIREHLGILDPERPPGYGAFIALVHLLPHHSGRAELVVAQAVLSVAVVFEIYVLGFRLGGSRALAAIAAGLVAVNLYILDWERVLITEILGTWVLVSVLVLLEAWLRSRRASLLTAIAGGCFAAVMVKSSFLYLPALVFGLVAVVAWRVEWRRLLLLGVGVYAAVAAYAVANDHAFPGAGLTDISNQNLFGKVMEYRMQLAGDPGRYTALRDETDRYVRGGGKHPYEFGIRHPDLVGPYWSTAAAFSRSVIAADPATFARRSLQDTYIAAVAEPYLFAPLGGHPGLVEPLGRLSLESYKLYWLLPMGAAWVGVALLRRGDPREFGILALAILVGVHLAAMATGAFDDFQRLRVAVDPVMFLAALLMAGAPLRWLRR